jgi:hypothetical protein
VRAIRRFTINKALLFAAALGASSLAAAAYGEPWVDYTPTKGATMVTSVHVDPDKIDDYLVALKKTWIPSEESLKKHGLIDYYQVQVNTNPYGAGPNVVLVEHWPALSGLEPDKARDMAMQKEFEAIEPKSQQSTTMAERGKYRTILSQDMWTSVDFPK